MKEEIFAEHLDYFRFDEAAQLLESDSKLSRVTCGGNTGLHLAARYGAKKFVEVWVNQGIDVNVFGETKTFGTPLRGAIQEGFFDIVSMLLEAGADPNCEITRPCVNAVVHRPDALIYLKLLARYGADLSATFVNELTGESLSLRDWGVRWSREDVVAFLDGSPKESNKSSANKFSDYGLGEYKSELDCVAGNVPFKMLRFDFQGVETLVSNGLANIQFSIDTALSEYENFELSVQIRSASPSYEEETKLAGELLKDVADFLVTSMKWAGHPLTIVSLANSLGKWKNGQQIRHIMLFASNYIDNPETALIKLVPLYDEEVELHTSGGIPALLNALEDADVPSYLSINRESAIGQED